MLEFCVYCGQAPHECTCPPPREIRVAGPVTGGQDTCLTRAAALVDGPRRADYGHPIMDFSRTAGMLNGLWRDKLKADLTPLDVALAMICVKLSRLQSTPGHADSVDDIAGYTRTYEMVRDYEEGV